MPDYRDFNPCNLPGTCLWCGYTLNKGVGGHGDGYFCNLRCSYMFAVKMAKLGERFKAISETPTKKPKSNAIKMLACPFCGKRPLSSSHWNEDHSEIQSCCDEVFERLTDVFVDEDLTSIKYESEDEARLTWNDEIKVLKQELKETALY